MNLWKKFFLYILCCSDGSYYVGHTDNIEKRISDHSIGIGSSYTKKRLPIKVLYVQEFASRYEALVAERKIKGWRRAKKEAFMQGDWGLLANLSQRRLAFKK